MYHEPNDMLKAYVCVCVYVITNTEKMWIPSGCQQDWGGENIITTEEGQLVT